MPSDVKIRGRLLYVLYGRVCASQGFLREEAVAVRRLKEPAQQEITHLTFQVGIKVTFCKKRGLEGADPYREPLIVMVGERLGAPAQVKNYLFFMMGKGDTNTAAIEVITISGSIKSPL